MIVLNGDRMDSRTAIHAELKQKLSLPDYYGGNLDALNDCLGERTGQEPVVIEHSADFLGACGEYAARVLRVFCDNGVKVLLD